MAAGPRGSTSTTATPRSSGAPRACAIAGVTVRPVTPSQECRAVPVAMIESATGRIVSMGMANPMPSLPPLWEAIWELMPTTRPRASSSGPPEFPWLIAASVWMTFWMSKSLGELMMRFRAETIPVVAVRSSPKGLPIAMTGSPTTRSPLVPSGSGRALRGTEATLSTARSVLSSRPSTSARSSVPSSNVTVAFLAEPSTWAFVRMRPRGSTRKPDPSRSSAPPPAVTFTTAGELSATTACTPVAVAAAVASRGCSARVAAAAGNDTGSGVGSRAITVSELPRFPVSAAPPRATSPPMTAGTSDAVSQRGGRRRGGAGAPGYGVSRGGPRRGIRAG